VENHSPILRVLPSKAELRAVYDRLSWVYGLLADRAEKPIRQAALKSLDPTQGLRVLEIGPGTGHGVAALAQCVSPGGYVVGLDLSEGMLELTRDQVRAKGCQGVGLVQGDGARLPLRDGIFDAVLLCFTLELFDTPEIPLVLGECQRVLKAGGRLVVAALSKTGGESVPVQLYEWSHRCFPNLVNCRPIRAQEAIEAASFRVDSRRLLSIWLPVELVVAVRV
jgi:demethylmenaquinone methyltransferase/2-methoxy-6-polyprenyl-1,4-benzoquinol methylase